MSQMHSVIAAVIHNLPIPGQSQRLRKRAFVLGEAIASGSVIVSAVLTLMHLAARGQGTVALLATRIQLRQLGLRGFFASNMWAVRQFFDTGCGSLILAPLVRELSPGNNLPISGQNQRLRMNASVFGFAINLCDLIVPPVVAQMRLAAWARCMVTLLATRIQLRQPGLLGFFASNIWAARQFFDTGCGNLILAPLVRELSLGNKLQVPGKSPGLGKNAFALCEHIVSRPVIVSAVLNQMRLAVRASFERGHGGRFLNWRQGVHHE